LHHILHERNKFLNLFAAAAYRISIGLVMSVTGDRVTLQLFAVPGVLLPRVRDRSFLQLAHPVLMFPRGKPEGNIVLVAAESLFHEIPYRVRRWYMYTKLHGVTSQKKTVDLVTAARDIRPGLH
jgi:hypothetical protein